MRSLTLRERRIAILTAIIVGGGIVYLYVVEPAAGAWLAAYREAGRLENELAKLEGLVEQRDVIEREYQRLESVATTVPSREAMMVSLLSEVTTLAQRSGLGVVGIKPLSVAGERVYERAGVQVDLEGAAHDFASLLQGMQEEGHLLNAEFINVVVGRGEAPLTISMRLNKLYFPGDGG